MNLYGTLVAGVEKSAIRNDGGSSSIFIDGGKVLVNQTTNIVGGTDYTFLYYSGGRIGYTLGSGGVTFEVNNPATITRVSGTLQNASGVVGTVTKTGSGTLQLLPANNYTGVTTIQGGVVEILSGNATSGYTGGFAMEGGTLKNNAAYTMAVNGASAGTNVLLGNVKDRTNATANTAMTITGNSTVLSLGNATTAGNLTTTGYVLVENGGTLNIVNGTNTIHGVRPAVQKDGIHVLNSTLNVSGGTTTMGYNFRLENGTMTMTGGTVTVGTSSSTSEAYNVFIGGNGTGTATITGGTLDSKQNIYVGWSGADDSSLTLDGGTLKAGNSDGGLVFGNSGGCSMDFIRGTVAVNRMGNRMNDTTPGTIQIYGNNITWSNYDGTGNIAAVSLNSNLTTNLVVASDGFSTLTAESIYFAGKANVSYAGGAGVFSEYDLIKGTTFTGSGTVTSTGLFTAGKGVNGISLTGLNSQLEVESTFSRDGVRFSSTESGWFTTPYDISDLILNLDLGNSNADEFLAWLNGETYYDHEATLTDGQLSLGNLTSLVAGEAFFWDFSGFDGIVRLTGLSGTVDMPGVPEPSTWGLLLGGWVFLLWGFGRRFRKNGGE